MYEYVKCSIVHAIFLMFFRAHGLDMCFIGFRQIPRFRAQNSLTPSSDTSPANFYPSGAPADSCPLLATDSQISFWIVDMLFHKISFTVDPWYKQVFQRCCQQPSSCIARIECSFRAAELNIKN